MPRPMLLDVLNAPWAILPDKLIEIRDVYLTHLRGEKIDIHAIEERLGRPLANESKPYQMQGGVAIIPIEGVLAKRMNLFSQVSGGTSTQILKNDFQTALDDPAVHSILLLIDSAGGEVDGTQELANTIHAARGQKPIMALADSMMASAAYWIGAAADQVFVSGDTTQVGSIGVVATHTDYSAAEEKKGIKVTEITAGKYKRIASAHAPLTDAGLQSIQEKVDYVYSIFVNDVAAFRGVTTEKVLSDMADGRLFFGKAAVEAGLVDGFGTQDALIARLRQQRIHGGTMSDATAPKTFTEAEVAQLVDAARAEGTTAGLKTGADTERARIKAVQDQTLPGHEALIEEMKFDGVTSGNEAAGRVLAAEKKINADRLTTMRREAPQPVPASTDDQAQPTGATGYDPNVVGKKAQEYQAKERKEGREISTTEAVAFVLKQNAAR